MRSGDCVGGCRCGWKRDEYGRGDGKKLYIPTSCAKVELVLAVPYRQTNPTALQAVTAQHGRSHALFSSEETAGRSIAQVAVVPSKPLKIAATSS